MSKNTVNRIRHAALIGLAFTVTTSLHGQEGLPEFEVVDLGTSGRGGFAIANDVNERGWVAGEWDTPDEVLGARHAVIWIDGEMIDLTPEPDVASAVAWSINNNGVVAGQLDLRNSTDDGGFRWTNGERILLPTHGPAGAHGARGVDERDHVLGYSSNDLRYYLATIWDPQLRLRQLPTFGGQLSIAYDANGWGRVVGSSQTDPNQSFSEHAFLWNGKEILDLGVLPGFDVSVALAINTHDVVVGRVGLLSSPRAFVWTSERGMADLGDFGVLPTAYASDINDAGTIVGHSWREDGRTAAIWIDQRLYDLNDLIDPTSDWKLIEARGINERGDIVGWGTYRGGGRAFLARQTDGGLVTTIGPTPGRAGRLNDVEIVSATPGADVLLLYGFNAQATVVPGCPGVFTDIANPRGVAIRANEHGEASVAGYIPEVARGMTLLFQAVDIETCRVSNLVVRRID